MHLHTKIRIKSMYIGEILIKTVIKGEIPIKVVKPL